MLFKVPIKTAKISGGTRESAEMIRDRLVL